jgi:hypothetical protein
MNNAAGRLAAATFLCDLSQRRALLRTIFALSTQRE